MIIIEQSKKRQTNSKDINNRKKPLKIKFTPKQIAQFETITIPGMNNSGRNRYIKNGVQAQQYQTQEAKRKKEEALSRSEMRPVIIKKVTRAEKIKGKKNVVKQVPQVIGMSGTDPIGKFIVEGIGLGKAINGLIRLGKVAYNAYKATGTKLGKNLLGNIKSNSKITIPDIQKSLIEAKKYKDSEGYKELVYKAQKEAKEMGLPFNSNLYIGVNNNFPSIKLNSRPKGKVGGYRRSTNTVEIDPDQLNVIEVKYVPFHEGLHWQNIGRPQIKSPLYNKWLKNMDDQQAWLEFYQSKEYKNLAYRKNAEAYAEKKIKEALYEDIKDPYLAIPGELQANSLEAGRAIGLKPFAEYPGHSEAIKAIDKARNYNSWLYDIKAGTPQEIQNFWKILTGNYLPSVSIPLITGYTIFNQPQQQSRYNN